MAMNKVLSGDQVEAGSAFGANNRLVRTDGTSRQVQDSGITVDDSDNMTGVNSLTLSTDLAIAHGGTGASSASAARTALGLEIGTDVQAWDATLDDLAAGGSTARDAIGLGTGDDVEFSGVKVESSSGPIVEIEVEDGAVDQIASLRLLGSNDVGTSSQRAFISARQPSGGAGTDTELVLEVRKSGDPFGSPGQAMSITQDLVDITGEVSADSLSLTTDLAIAHGGTGASSASAARTALGLEIGTDVQAWDATLDDLATGGSTARDAIDLGTSDDVEFNSLDITSTTAAVKLTESDGTFGINRTWIAHASDDFWIQSRAADDTLVSNDYKIDRGGLGGFRHTWFVNGSNTLSLETNNLTLTSAVPRFQSVETDVSNKAWSFGGSGGNWVLVEESTSTIPLVVRPGCAANQLDISPDLVDITGEVSADSLSLTTDLAIAHGGTGASSASAARTALGLEIGTDVQAWDATLDDLATGGSTARDAIDLGTSDDVEFNSLTMDGNRIGGTSITIADDAVGNVTPPRNGGFAFITCNGDGGFPQMNNYSGTVVFDVGNTVFHVDMLGKGSNFNTDSGTTPTGTTGSDGAVNVYVNSGQIDIENRSGDSRTFQVTFL